MVQAIDSLDARNTQVLWKLMEPVDQSKLRDDFKRISNNDIDAYNRAAVEVSVLLFCILTIKKENKFIQQKIHRYK